LSKETRRKKKRKKKKKEGEKYYFVYPKERNAEKGNFSRGKGVQTLSTEENRGQRK